MTVVVFDINVFSRLFEAVVCGLLPIFDRSLFSRLFEAVISLRDHFVVKELSPITCEELDEICTRFVDSYGCEHCLTHLTNSHDSIF